MLDFISLPQSALYRIFTLLDHKCVLRMREVCKRTQEIISTWAETQKSTIRQLSISEEKNKSSRIYIHIKWLFANIRDCVLWKIRIAHSSSKHELSKFFTNSTLLTPPFFRVFQKNINAKQAKHHFASMKPFIVTAQLCNIFLHNLRPAIFAAVAEFIKHNEIAAVYIRHETSARFAPKSLLQSIRRCKINTLILLIIPRIPEFFEFLINLSEIVPEIAFTFSMKDKYKDTVPYLLPIYVVQNIFSRKCKKLRHIDYEVQCNSEYIDQLIKLFHHNGKKAIFQAGLGDRSYNVHIGKVKVESGGPFGLRISSI